MFLNDVLKKEECRNEALQELRRLGVKSRPKKPKQQSVKSNQKVFKVPLRTLSSQTVTLETGQQIVVPKLVHDLCSNIMTKASTEGLFRKEGSRARQGEMKLILIGGGMLDPNSHVIDVAVLLKTFLRELPEPLIPHTHHDIFLECTLQHLAKHKTEALLLACLLLPLEHLNTLTYILQFLSHISAHSASNKMDPYNLAVVIGPSIFPIDDKLSQSTAQLRTTKIREIIQCLIENSSEVGIIPPSIIQKLGDSNTSVAKKKRRSGSLTRMFNGLKKMVGGKSQDNLNIVTPDLLLTPINNNVKKRRQSNGISNKKKKEVIGKLPDSVLLNTPFTPCRTPISMDMRATSGTKGKETSNIVKEKKCQWFLRSRSLKNLKQESLAVKSTKSTLERRWSAINPAHNLKKIKKRGSIAAIPAHVEEPDYIRVPKVEYEAIKSRVSAMEHRISMELDSVQSQDTNLQSVQTAYEQTLEQSAPMSPTTDHLARRLSRELKIRRSCEQKIIRSPSARKIGSLRRKSKEMERNSAKVTRHQSWHAPSKQARSSLRRGKPNTVMSGLPASKVDMPELPRTVSCNLSGSSDAWTSAEGFFTTMKSHDGAVTDRASLARLRSQNAGMVLAKAKLFDKLSDSESSSSRSAPRAKAGSKIGAARSERLSYRVRSLKYEDRKLKSMSPRRRALSQKQKLQLAKQCLSSSASDKENISDSLDKSLKFSTPRIPHIKKQINVRSPKRLCRTPVKADRGTPLRVLKTPQRNI